MGRSIGRDREASGHKNSGGGPEADKKALGWGAQGSEARWARRDQKSGWPIGSWGGSAVRHLVGKVVL